MKAHWLDSIELTPPLPCPALGHASRSGRCQPITQVLSVHANLTISKPCPGIAGVVIAIELYSPVVNMVIVT